MAFDSDGGERRGGEAGWVMQQHMQSDPKSSWPSASRYGSDNGSWSGGGAESAYPGYPSYWYPPSHVSGSYSHAYSPEADAHGQRGYAPQAGAPYPNGMYTPGQYPTSMIYPANPFYCSDQLPARHAPYHAQAGPDPSVGASAPSYYLQHPPAAFPAGSYPVAEPHPPSAPYNTQPALPRAPPEAWSHAVRYAPAAPQNQWPCSSQTPHAPYGTRPPQPPPWRGPAPPPYEAKDPQGPTHRPPRPRPAPPSPRPEEEPSPGLARVQHILTRVQLLQEDVDEFVGRKTDKSYRCLEELLTKELLDLDSVETRGQEVVRQARREAVQLIQEILERLERKAF